MKMVMFLQVGQIFEIDPNITTWKVEFKNKYTFNSTGIALNGSSYGIFAGCRNNDGNYKQSLFF